MVLVGHIFEIFLIFFSPLIPFRYFGLDAFLSSNGARATNSAGSNANVFLDFFTCIILSFLT